METHNSECKISLTCWQLGNQTLICDVSGESGNQTAIITNAVGCWVLGARYIHEACTEGYSNIIEMCPANEITLQEHACNLVPLLIYVHILGTHSHIYFWSYSSHLSHKGKIQSHTVTLFKLHISVARGTLLTSFT